MLHCNSTCLREQNVSVVDKALNILTNTFYPVHEQAIERIKANKYPDGFHSRFKVTGYPLINFVGAKFSVSNQPCYDYFV